MVAKQFACSLVQHFSRVCLGSAAGAEMRRKQIARAVPTPRFALKAVQAGCIGAFMHRVEKQKVNGRGTFIATIVTARQSCRFVALRRN
jgi:hypothetical protein